MRKSSGKPTSDFKALTSVKARLKRLAQTDETWEASFRALPQLISQTQTHYLGMVVTKKGGRLLADMTVHGKPTVNDLATLLANSMRRPLDADDVTGRFKTSHSWALQNQP